MRRILVTGAGGSAASNFIDSLRLATERFYLVGTDVGPYHLELADVDARYLLPPVDDPAYLSALNAVIEAEEVEFVHAQPDPEVLFLARRRAEVGARILLPDTKTLETCQDKLRFARSIQAAGLPVPEFAGVDSENTLREGTERILDRHAKVWVRATRGAGARASLPVTNSEQAVQWVRYWIDVKGFDWDDFMVTEFLPGREFAFQSLWREGELLTSQARERLQYLFGHLVPSGQTSTPSVARTVHRSDVNELASDAIRALDAGATGVFCADLKEDADGRPLLTEINAGRFFTTSNFLARAGLNMPHLYVKLAYGDELPELRVTDAVEDGLYWVRMIDMGFKLVREGEWTSRALS